LKNLILRTPQGREELQKTKKKEKKNHTYTKRTYGEDNKKQHNTDNIKKNNIE